MTRFQPKWLIFFGLLCFFNNLIPANAMEPIEKIIEEEEEASKPKKNAPGPRRRSLSATAQGLEFMAEIEERRELKKLKEQENSIPSSPVKNVRRRGRAQSLSVTLGPIKRVQAARNLIPETEEDKNDKAYFNFLKETPGFGHLEEPAFFYENPAKDLLSIIKREKDLTLKEGFNESSMPAGRYATLKEMPFAVRQFRNDVIYPLPRQGWKIHISAQPQSAMKIAAFVFSVIDKDIYPACEKLAKKNITHSYFKISSSIPAMRTMYYLTGNLQGDGRETQAGKFITIYPANKKHAIALVKAIDEIFCLYMRAGLLSDKDFYPLAGEAIIGKSGFVNIRYGNMSSAMDFIRSGTYHEAKPKLIIPMPPKKSKMPPSIQEENSLEESHIELHEELIPDDRYHPWPDFMNKGKHWKDVPDPFPGLNIRWIVPGSAKIISWDTRPDSWPKLY